MEVRKDLDPTKVLEHTDFENEDEKMQPVGPIKEIIDFEAEDIIRNRFKLIQDANGDFFMGISDLILTIRGVDFAWIKAIDNQVIADKLTKAGVEYEC